MKVSHYLVLEVKLNIKLLDSTYDLFQKGHAALEKKKLLVGRVGRNVFVVYM